MEYITRNDIMQHIPEAYRHFFDLQVNKITSDLERPFKLFTQAVNILCAFANINKKADIFFNLGNKGQAYSENFLLNYEIRGNAIHIYYNNCIFFDIAKSSLYSEPLQLAMYLEELCHCYMNIKDEVLVKAVVANICPYVIYNVESDQYEELTEN